MFNIKVTPYNLRDPCRIVNVKCQNNKTCLKCLTYEGNRIWNSLSVHMKGTGSLGIFKDRISKWQLKFLNRY